MFFSEQKIDLRAICAVASIDVKRDEHGLLEYAASLRAPLRFYSAAELDALPGSFDESAFVRAAVGVGNVSERAAVYEGGRLLIRKPPWTALPWRRRPENGVFCMNKLYVVGIGAGNYEG